MNELALFAGAGGGILGGTLLGWRTVAAVEIEDYPRAVLLQRQADGILHRFPVWDDVCTFDGNPWRGRVDIISGGFPCQDISAAGKGAGITGERSGLWSEFSRIISEVRPRFVFVENSPLLISRGLDTVLSDLAEMGLDAEWGIIGAHHAGAPHKRDRIWILAYAEKEPRRKQPENVGNGTARYGRGEPQQGNTYAGYVANPDSLDRRTGTGRKDGAEALDGGGKLAHTDGEGLQRPDVRETEYAAEAGLSTERSQVTWWDIDPADVPDTDSGERGGWTGDRDNGRKRSEGEVEGRRERTLNDGSTKPIVGRVAHGVAHRVDRLKAIGNGQVPAVAALAFMTLYRRIHENK